MSFNRILIAATLWGSIAVVIDAQVIRAIRPFKTSGTVKAVRDGAIAITDKTGKSWQMHISSRDDGRVALGKNRFFSARKPKVEITGSLSIDALESDALVRFENHIDRKNRIAAPVAKLMWVDKKGFKPGVRLDRTQKNERGAVACIVSGMVDEIAKDRLVLRMPRSRYASKGKLVVALSDSAIVDVTSRDLSKVHEKDRVTSVEGVELTSGDFIVQKLAIRLVEGRPTDQPRRRRQPPPAEEPVDPKYTKLSDNPVAPRVVRNQHYIVHTDMSDRQAKILLDKLEKMIGLVSRYYGRPQPGVVECYVVEDLKRWPQGMFSEAIKAKMANKEGLTKLASAVSTTGVRNARSIVYACSDPGVVQHEAVHAYCNLAFGGTGPIWYSEGMAEMGQYWKDHQRAVDVDERVIRYIRKSKQPKRLKEIIKPGQITGDSWEAYSWRWALCHLLASNPNYNRKFKDLGIGLMMGKPNVSFASAYGRVAKQLTFEYEQFVQHVGNGYRADLCAWRWKHRFKDVEDKGHQSVKVLAKAGWQPAVRVEEGIEYDVAAKGEWQLDGTGTKANADGINEGNGKLSAIVMKDYALSEPIPLGVKAKFNAPTTGDLYLRCGEDWTRIGDNSGSVTAYIRRTQ